MVNFVLLVGTVGVLALCTIHTIQAQKVTEQLPNMSVLLSFIETYIKPYLKTLNLNNNDPSGAAFRSQQTKDDSIAKAIENKVKKLLPLLQDNDHIDIINKHEDSNNDETTIIEFTPTSHARLRAGKNVKYNGKEPTTFKETIKKYKSLREQVRLMMENERISSNMKQLVLNTLDDMIAQMVASRCSWRSNIETPDQVFRRQNIKTRRAIQKMYNMSHNQWTDLREEFTKYLETKSIKEISFMNQFQEFFRTLLTENGNATDLPDEYKIECKVLHFKKQAPLNVTSLTSLGTSDEPVLRESEIYNQCGNFKLCSEELKEFLNYFYSKLNDTSVSIFRNYAAMYVRDAININSESDKEIVTSFLKKLSNKVEHKVAKIFKHNLDKFQVDKNKKRKKNIMNIRKLISDTTAETNQSVLMLTDTVLNSNSNEIFKTVIVDLGVNTKLDLENMRHELLEGVCKPFYVCNSKYLTRRKMTSDKDNYVFVKMQFNLDDELKHSLKKHAVWKPWEEVSVNVRSGSKSQNIARSGFNKNKYNRSFPVTRTTRYSSK